MLVLVLPPFSDKFARGFTRGISYDFPRTFSTTATWPPLRSPAGIANSLAGSLTKTTTMAADTGRRQPAPWILMAGECLFLIII